ncbi:MAG: type II toxin-antitoxin system HicA family toxin [Bacteroidetes bacterium]|nr:type II toxin-antitoxin system HicA family toxin [Bacteroidota bacterium]MBU2506730.1 type II toxin-antitoxin system HicA family toxin [Bacteroidota bacterium]
MSKLNPIKPDKLIKSIEKLGFVKIRQSGSHIVYRHTDGRWTTIPMHKGKDVAKGTLAKILKDVGLTYQEFININ